MKMTDNTHQTRDQKHRWTAVVLVISLGLNILIIGVIAGALLRDGKPTGVRSERDIAALGLRTYYRALDKKHRVGLRKSARAQDGEFRRGTRAIRAALFSLADRLEAEPFDLDAVKAELALQADVIAGNISFGHRLLLDQISRMTPEERLDMARNLRHPPRRSGVKNVQGTRVKRLN